MPNARAHRKIGVVAGALAAGCSTRREPTPALLVEVLAGALGGLLTARLPDIIEPPTCPRHRGVGHAHYPSALLFAAALKRVPQWQARLRAAAASEVRSVRDAASDQDRAACLMRAGLYHAASGLVLGAVA